MEKNKNASILADQIVPMDSKQNVRNFPKENYDIYI